MMDVNLMTLNEKLDRATVIMEAEIKRLEDEIELEIRLEMEEKTVIEERIKKKVMLGASKEEVIAEKKKLQQFENRLLIKPQRVARVDRTKVQALKNQIVKAETDRHLLKSFAKGISKVQTLADIEVCNYKK